MMKFLDKLLGDEEIAALLGSERDIEAMVRFELALLRAQNVCGQVSAPDLDAISSHLAVFRLDDQSLTDATLRDGVVVPDLVRQMRSQLPDNLRSLLHAGATSQDVIDTAFAIKLSPVLRLLEDRLAKVIAELDVLVGKFGCNGMMGRTRMQQAIPVRVLDRLLAWRGPLERAFENLHQQEMAIKILTLSGAAGTSDKLGPNADTIRTLMAEELGLLVPDYVPHAQRDRIVNFANWLSVVSGALGKMGQDIALMAQNEMSEIALSGGGASSAMPHKQNPVTAEILVTLARFNAVQISGLHHAMVHEQERSGAAWSLEWMILPQMIEATGVAMSHGIALLQSVQRIGSA